MRFVPRKESDMTTQPLRSSTRNIHPELSALLISLRPGQRIRVTQTIRVGSKHWPAVVEGVFRALNYLATGLATDRVPDDDIIVVVVHFTKDNGEMSSITLDDATKVEKLG
jgi:hypothetical protein